MSRDERRHHEDRVKAKWRKRVRAEPGPSLSAWKAPPPAQEVEQRAVRRAHHNKCPCAMCKKDDHHDRLPKPKERSTGSGRGGGR